MSLDLGVYKLVPCTGNGRDGVQGKVFSLGTADDLATAVTAGYIDALVNLSKPYGDRAVYPGDLVLLNYLVGDAGESWATCRVDYTAAAGVDPETYTLTQIQTGTGGGGGGDVTSVFGRTGAVVSAINDYEASQIKNIAAGGITSGDVQAALNELDTAKLGSALASAKILVGSAGGVATPVSVSGNISMDNTGATTIAPFAIVDAMINASAAIALSKLAAVTVSRALVSDIDGFMSASSVTGAELAYLSGVTAGIQTQLNAKAPSASPTFTGTVTMGAKLDVATGANTSVGTVTLNGTTPVVVSNTSITASSIVFLSKVTDGGTPGITPTYTVSAGVSFSVTGVALDTLVYNYLIIN